MQFKGKPVEVIIHERNDVKISKLEKKAHKVAKYNDTLYDALKKAGVYDQYNELVDYNLQLEERRDYKTYYSNLDPFKGMKTVLVG